MMFSKKHTEQIRERGIEPADVEKQINNFVNGFPYLNIKKPAVPGDGIIQLSEKEKSGFIAKYQEEKKHYRLLKFVPASGAASRMFKDLQQFMQRIEYQKEEGEMPSVDINLDFVQTFFNNLKSFAFYHDLKNILREKDKDIEKLIANRQYLTLLRNLLTREGLNYNFLPKGLLKFHQYEGFSRTPVEEHIAEAVEYCVSKNHTVNLHFTILEEHLKMFSDHIKMVKGKFEEKYKVNIKVAFSVQEKSTDMIAVDEHNEPFLDKDGNLLFRPGGHGALLYNLNQMDADIVFIKNIDNVVPELCNAETVIYKKILAGVLISLKEKIFSYIYLLDKNSTDIKLLAEIKEFIQSRLYTDFSSSFEKQNTKEKAKILHDLLNRPIRVCGMVKNAGEPGGGPFWVEHDNGYSNLQILEKNQIDLHNPDQKYLFEQSTHFNPVDLVCYLKNYKGKKFNLFKYRDNNAGFISSKFYEGKEIKAQELPGLWNGSMAMWNTVFVEIPLSIFNPVKNVNDLLRVSHQLLTEN